MQGKQEGKQNQKKQKGGIEVNPNQLLGFEIPNANESNITSIYTDRKKHYGSSLKDKEKYLQSNFKFVVNPSANYGEIISNSAKQVDWDTVELVICTVYGAYECPICLEKELVIPKVTKCGHIFCLICIQQHIHHQVVSQIPRKCPLCYSLIDSQELKSCEIKIADYLKEGQEVELHLVRRNAKSIIIKDEAALEKGIPISTTYIYNPGIIPITRTVLTYNIDNIIKKERDDLKNALWLANSTQDLHLIPFIEQSIEELNARDINFKKNFAGFKSIFPEIPDKEDFFFSYQISTGDNIFILQLDLDCIMDEYGSYDNLPTMLKAPILEISNIQLDLQFKRKHKYTKYYKLNK